MKQDIAHRQQEFKKAKEKNRECFESDCKKQSIDSHILQKNGVISRIADNGHVMECATDLFEPEYLLKFKKIGVNKVFTFKGFCTEHDNNLFKEIEVGDYDLNEYKHQLLFAYRTSVNETRKKETVIDFYNSLLTSSSSPYMKQYMNQAIAGQRMGIEDGEFTRQLLKRNIEDPGLKDFEFYTFSIPKVEICVCGVYSFETSNEIKLMEITGDPRYNEPLTDIFLTCLPLEEESVLSIGFIRGHNPQCDKYYSELSESNIDRKIQFLSDTMLLQIENWITSEAFYKSNILPKEKDIKTIINLAQSNWDERASLNINIFN